LRGASREVHQVYVAFAKLIRIVRMSNVTYFSGDLVWAHDLIQDALKLFQRIGDKKAQGIAFSNLANTLHAMYYNAVYCDDCCKMIPGTCCLKSALMNYDEAIAIAEFQLEHAVELDEKAQFSQQLADRLFNRGLFLLLVYNEPCAPDDAKRMALHDFIRARDIDSDVKDYQMEHGLLFKNSADHFCRLLRRSLGLLAFFGGEFGFECFNFTLGREHLFSMTNFDDFCR
jgi:hypothetical protein